MSLIKLFTLTLALIYISNAVVFICDGEGPQYCDANSSGLNCGIEGNTEDFYEYVYCKEYDSFAGDFGASLIRIGLQFSDDCSELVADVIFIYYNSISDDTDPDTAELVTGELSYELPQVSGSVDIEIPTSVPYTTINIEEASVEIGPGIASVSGKVQLVGSYSSFSLFDYDIFEVDLSCEGTIPTDNTESENSSSGPVENTVSVGTIDNSEEESFSEEDEEGSDSNSDSTAQDQIATDFNTMVFPSIVFILVAYFA
eukprot:TRINITY_DN560_c0_g1_i1.p1 TRINITY_DN560_c0_g1~~TRINITY_DN560_c0_g1_i1.p1  ORF type:complete len:257 (-),score=74.00 TRINITY_DN560_c0_g1_i1:37-807(-)